MDGDGKARGKGEKKMESEESKCCVAADQKTDGKMEGEEDNGGPAMRARDSKRKGEEDGLSPGSQDADQETDRMQRKVEDGELAPKSESRYEEEEKGKSLESRRVMDGDEKARGKGEKKMESEESKCCVAADQKTDGKMEGEEDNGGPAMRAKDSKRKGEEDGLSPGSQDADQTTDRMQRKVEDGELAPKSESPYEEEEKGKSIGSRMTSLGLHSSPPTQDFKDSSCPDIKLLLGRQEEGIQEVSVNREALAGLSSVFKSMLSHDMVENKQSTVRLETVSLEAWNVISAFYFSHEILVTMDNMQDIVSVVDMYELTDMKNYCDDYLVENAEAYESFSDLLNWATAFRLTKLKTNLMKLVREDFIRFTETDSFLRLSSQVLLEILSGPYIVSDEQFVCLAVLRWLQHQNADKAIVERMFKLLKLNEVCLSCLERQYAAPGRVVLQLIEKEKQEREKETLQRLPLVCIAQSRHGVGHLQLLDKADSRLVCTFCTFERQSGELADPVFLGGRYSNVSHGILLDQIVANPTEVALIWQGFSYTACFFENFLVVKELDSSTEFFDRGRKVWKGSQKLKQARQSNGMVSMGDAIYVVMGSCENVNLDSIEVFRNKTTGWLNAGRMQIATTDVAAVAVGNLFIACGLSGEERIYQSFNTETKEAVVLHRDQQNLRLQGACSWGSRAALFKQAGSLICIQVQENGEVAISEEQYPGTSAAFSEIDFRAPEVQIRVGGKEGFSLELQQLAHIHPEDVLFSVLFSPGGKRANIMPLYIFVDRLIQLAVRK